MDTELKNTLFSTRKRGLVRNYTHEQLCWMEDRDSCFWMTNTIFQSSPICQIYTGPKDESSGDEFILLILQRSSWARIKGHFPNLYLQLWTVISVITKLLAFVLIWLKALTTLCYQEKSNIPVRYLLPNFAT